ncbi:hypothetical protein, partial [Caballeronia sp. AAUFL_F1_KS45]|uniref:hypothetical protein n=1 Tax=Caballeronia sp. AAUFL_F1_KS45 TaxID=2921770 RepID=UPI002028BF20
VASVFKPAAIVAFPIAVASAAAVATTALCDIATASVAIANAILAAAAGIAVRRSLAEKELALDVLNRARATAASVLANHNLVIADLEVARM